ncbi:MAG TPA: acetate kinase [Meiothermus sp.]|nr:acetate kinase [Meiothermus sp.]
MGLTLVLNSGSSSLKFSLLDPETRRLYLSGLAEKLLVPTPQITFRSRDHTRTEALPAKGHKPAMQAILAELEAQGFKERVEAVGHRVVHGGERFKSSTRITPEVIAAIEACAALAPLHNPANLLGIRLALAHFPQVPQVAVFDTAFHQTLPEYAYRYALPGELYTRYGVRRYGFHGTSHQYVTRRAAELLGRPLETLGLISAHLGNGCSITAVRQGQSVDTSMGLTPLEGLVMGTRSGDLDPNIPQYLSDTLGLTLEQITELLNKKSGLLGLSGLSNDMRELEQAAAQDHAGAKLALEVFCYRLAKYVAAMSVPLGRIDALIFTGGIGENSAWVRRKTLKWLGGLGFQVDEERNQQAVRGQPGIITAEGSTLAMVVNTDEELMIAWETRAVLS